MITEKDDDQGDGGEPTGDEERLTVPIGDEGDDDAGDDAGADAAGQDRAGKKRERRRVLDELEAERGRNKELSDRLTRSEQAQQEMRQAIETTRTEIRQARGDGNDPLEAELNEVLDAQQALAEQAAALGDKMTKEQEARLQRQARDLRIREQELITERVNKRNQRPRDPYEGVRAGVRGAFPEVFANPKAVRFAKGFMDQKIARVGEPQNEAELAALMRESCEVTMREFLNKRPAPTETERKRFNGVPRGGAGGSGRKEVTEVDMSDAVHQRMANAAFPHIKDKKERYKKWASGAGKRLVEKKVIRGR